MLSSSSHAALAVALLTAALGAANPAHLPRADHPAPIEVSLPTPFAPQVARDAQELRDFWTPERMREAVARSGEGDPEPIGTTSDASVPSANATAVSVARQEPAVSHIGRVFYTLNGNGYACSANVVESSNRSTVATAAHCMTADGNFSRDAVFVPGYEDGDAPYGEWPVVGGEIAGGYTQDNTDLADDTGFLVVAHDDDGADIQSVVGASPVAFNQSLVQEGSVFGYPAEGRFDGQSLQECSGVFQEYGPQQIDLPCDMNGGVSGGPIFAGDSSDGTQYANEDARYYDSSHVLGPIWQDNEEAAYAAAAQASS